MAACDRGALDGIGQAMLAPARIEALQPDVLVRRLALPSDAIVADVGAGPGAFSHALARAVPSGRVIATDVNARYLAHLAAAAAAQGERNLETREVSPEDPGLDAGSVDLAFLCQVDHYLLDRRAYLRKLAGALRPGGRIVLVNYVREQAGIEALARELGWQALDRWEPAAGLFARSYRTTPEATLPMRLSPRE